LNINQRTGAIIRQARLGADMTREELGRALTPNYPDTYIEDIEEGDLSPPFNVLVNIANVLDIPLMSFIIGREGQ